MFSCVQPQVVDTGSDHRPSVRGERGVHRRPAVAGAVEVELPGDVVDDPESALEAVAIRATVADE